MEVDATMLSSVTRLRKINTMQTTTGSVSFCQHIRSLVFPCLMENFDLVGGGGGSWLSMDAMEAMGVKSSTTSGGVRSSSTSSSKTCCFESLFFFSFLHFGQSDSVWFCKGKKYSNGINGPQDCHEITRSSHSVKGIGSAKECEIKVE
mmetsp:Transcript_4626/g.7064  ORF Transcript_4626/g.7064 Transcript_4626/m.7064 type:complete len:148 (+) Transcript_4626:119-562(+)